VPNTALARVLSLQRRPPVLAVGLRAAFREITTHTSRRIRSGCSRTYAITFTH
jgi:hypothetical protein